MMGAAPLVDGKGGVADTVALVARMRKREQQLERALFEKERQVRLRMLVFAPQMQSAADDRRATGGGVFQRRCAHSRSGGAAAGGGAGARKRASAERALLRTSQACACCVASRAAITLRAPESRSVVTPGLPLQCGPALVRRAATASVPATSVVGAASRCIHPRGAHAVGRAPPAGISSAVAGWSSACHSRRSAMGGAEYCAASSNERAGGRGTADARRQRSPASVGAACADARAEVATAVTPEIADQRARVSV